MSQKEKLKLLEHICVGSVNPKWLIILISGLNQELIVSYILFLLFRGIQRFRSYMLLSIQL